MKTGRSTSEPTRGEFPYWLAALAVLGVAAFVAIASNESWSRILEVIATGLWTTVFVTLVGFALACVVGLAIAVMALSRHRVLREIARFYVEIVRGVPIIVLLFYVAFVGAPALVWLVNAIVEPFTDWRMGIRDFPLVWRAAIALTIGYSAFIAEVFRAGIQAVPEGQIEAAKALGMRPWARFRTIVLPQAVRIMLPPLGNFFVAMVKDSSLVSVLGVGDMTQAAKVYAAGSFTFFETYSVLALMYLCLTISLSIALRRLEVRLDRERRERGPGGG